MACGAHEEHQQRRTPSTVRPPCGFPRSSCRHREAPVAESLAPNAPPARVSPAEKCFCDRYNRLNYRFRIGARSTSEQSASYASARSLSSSPTPSINPCTRGSRPLSSRNSFSAWPVTTAPGAQRDPGLPSWRGCRLCSYVLVVQRIVQRRYEHTTLSFQGRENACPESMLKPILSATTSEVERMGEAGTTDIASCIGRHRSGGREEVGTGFSLALSPSSNSSMGLSR